MQNFNTKIIDQIARQLPKNENPVHYLVKILSMSKETAYRRIRNQIPFSINEVAVIAEYFNLSVDQLLNIKSEDDSFFNRNFNLGWTPEDVYFNLLKNEIETMESLSASANIKITAALNRIPFRLLPYPLLFKLDYCHYLYSTGKISLMTSRFSDSEVPSTVDDLRTKAAACLSRLSPVTCIIDSMLYSNTIRKVHYYHRLGFVSGEDLKRLQAELFELLEMYETLLRNGKSSTGSNYIFYYSFFNLDSTTISIECGDDSLLQVWIYPESPLVVKNNEQVRDIQKRWIDSKIRNSTLISKTADIQQIEMLREIYKQVSELTKDL